MIRTICLTLLLVAPMALAQDPKDKPRQATLRWYGQSFFQLETGSGRKIVFAAAAEHRVTTVREFL